MEKRKLGASGLLVSKVGLGCNNFGVRVDAQTARRTVHAALEAGVTLFDTSDSYGGRGGSETLLGEALGPRRRDIVLATKFGSAMDDSGSLQGASRRYVFLAVEASLRRLRTDWIDLYQVHKPDPATPLEETLRALEDLVRQGKIRYAGVSNHPAWQVAEAIGIGLRHDFSAIVSCQDEYSLLNRRAERELIPAMQRFGLGLLPFYPLAGGLLTGKYRRGEPAPKGARLSAASSGARFFTEANWRKLDALQRLANARGVGLLDLAFGWLASRPVVASVIAGATSPEQLEANVRAADWRPTAEDEAQIEQATSE